MISRNPPVGQGAICTAAAILAFRETAELDELGDVTLPIIERDAAAAFPGLYLAKYGGHGLLDTVEGAIKTSEEQAQPPEGADEIEEPAALPADDLAGVVRRSPRRSGHRVFRSSYMS